MPRVVWHGFYVRDEARDPVPGTRIRLLCK